MRGETKTNVVLKKKCCQIFANSCARHKPELIWTEFIDVLKNMDTFYYRGFPLRYGIIMKAVTIRNHINNYCCSLECCISF
jgi:hypothetical protein